jgi:hypothetical protein
MNPTSVPSLSRKNPARTSVFPICYIPVATHGHLTSLSEKLQKIILCAFRDTVDSLAVTEVSIAVADISFYLVLRLMGRVSGEVNNCDTIDVQPLLTSEYFHGLRAASLAPETVMWW